MLPFATDVWILFLTVTTNGLLLSPTMSFRCSVNVLCPLLIWRHHFGTLKSSRANSISTKMQQDTTGLFPGGWILAAGVWNGYLQRSDFFNPLGAMFRPASQPVQWRTSHRPPKRGTRGVTLSCQQKEMTCISFGKIYFCLLRLIKYMWLSIVTIIMFVVLYFISGAFYSMTNLYMYLLWHHI